MKKAREVLGDPKVSQGYSDLLHMGHIMQVNMAYLSHHSLKWELSSSSFLVEEAWS